MADLRNQLRTYVEATTRHVSAAEAMSRRPAPPLWRQPRFLRVAVAAAVLIAVGVAVVLGLWLRAEDRGPAGTTTTTTPIGPDTLGDLGEWTVITPADDPPAFPGGGHIINDLAATDQVVVAVGDATAVTEDNAMRDAGVWISSDGLAWRRVSDPDDLEFGGKSLNTVIAAGPGFIAAGGSCDSDERCPFHPAIWTSTDGEDWDRVTDDQALFGERGAVYDLLDRGFEILAMSIDCYGDECGWAILSSPDGLTWTREFDSADAWPAGIAENETGIVAPSGDQAAAVWFSLDGREWEAIPYDEAVFGSGTDVPLTIADVAAGPQGFVAVGTDGDNAIVWFSADGRTWERIPHDPELFGGSAMMRVMPWRGGFLAAGPDWAITEEIGGPVPGMPSVPSQPTLWASPDGRIWYRIGIGPADDVGALRALTEFGSGVVAGGQAGTFLEGQEAVWVAIVTGESDGS